MGLIVELIEHRISVFEDRSMEFAQLNNRKKID